MPVEFSAGTVMAMLGIIVTGQLWIAHTVVTDKDLTKRFKQHNKRYHDN